MGLPFESLGSMIVSPQLRQEEKKKNKRRKKKKKKKKKKEIKYFL